MVMMAENDEVIMAVFGISQTQKILSVSFDSSK